MTDHQDLGKYLLGKEHLDVLLKEQDLLLVTLGAFSWIRGLSTTGSVVNVNLASLRDVVESLVTTTTKIEELVAEINEEAKGSGRPKIGIRVAERRDAGVVKLTLTGSQNELGGLRE